MSNIFVGDGVWWERFFCVVFCAAATKKVWVFPFKIDHLQMESFCNMLLVRSNKPSTWGVRGPDSGIENGRFCASFLLRFDFSLLATL